MSYAGAVQIVADENIPYAKDAFSGLGEVRLIAGREITASDVRDADLLMVRSVTRVNADLIKESRVRFVGSATIGVDHVDTAHLQERGIGFAYAPGSNANSVAEYVIAAILAVGLRSPATSTLGIIGLGRIGSLVKKKARALGMKVLANDPPLERAGVQGLISLKELLHASDIVTCHVPLTANVPDGTFQLLNHHTLAMLRPAAILINTARGPVVDNAALLDALSTGSLGGAVLDVWEGEPSPDPALMNAITLGTAHIAGYSMDGKVHGTHMLYEAACAFLERKPKWVKPALNDANSSAMMDVNRPLADVLDTLIAHSYDIRRDAAALRALVRLSSPDRGKAFDRLRANYPSRLEFIHTTVTVPSGHQDIREALLNIGFAVQESSI